MINEKDKNGYYEFILVNENNNKTHIDIFSPFTFNFSSLKEMIFLGASQSQSILTCEPNIINLNNKYKILSDENDKQNIYVGTSLSDENGNINLGESVIRLYLTSSQKYKTLSVNGKIKMQIEFLEVCSDMSINFISDDGTNKLIEIQNNQSKTLIIEEKIDFNLSTISINFFKTQKPQRYIKISKIILNDLEKFSREKVNNYNIIEETDITNVSLIKNKVEFEIDNLGYDWIDYKEYVKKHKNKVINIVFNTFKDKKIFLGEYIVQDIKYSKDNFKYVCEDNYSYNDIYYQPYTYQAWGVSDWIQEILNTPDNLFEGDIDYFNNLTLSGFLYKNKKIDIIRNLCQTARSLIKINKKLDINAINFKIKQLNDYKSKQIDYFLPRNQIIDENIQAEQKNLEVNVYDYTQGNTEEEFETTFDFKLKDMTYGIEEEHGWPMYYGHYKINFENPYDADSYDIISSNIYLGNDIQIGSFLPEYEINKNNRKSYSATVKFTLIVSMDVTPFFENPYHATLKLKGTRKSPQVFKKLFYGNENIENSQTIDNLNLTQTYQIYFDIDAIGQYYYDIINSDKISLQIVKNPYLEIGDIVGYTSKNGHKLKFIITKIETNQSINQNIEGVVINE